jgi:D-alanyl-D-alanine carboxypeptidase
MEQFLNNRPWLGTVLKIIGFVALVGLVCVLYFIGKHSDALLQSKIDAISTKLADVETKSQSRMDELTKISTDLQAQNKYLADTLLTEQQKNGSVAQQIGNITSSVSVLTRLAQTDPELLKKYSKVYFLNEHYVPLSLSTIDPSYIIQPGKILQIHASVYPKLKAMLDAAALDQVSLKVDSAYRSFGTQAVLKSNYKVLYGAGTANQFSAEQGYSEHQLGTTLDFTSVENGGGLSGFDQTKAFAWLNANAYKFGFILSYPKNNTYYQYEPWHWRFVGTPLAAKLHQENTNFYDADQRIIDGYLVDIFN